MIDFKLLLGNVVRENIFTRINFKQIRFMYLCIQLLVCG